MTCSNCETETLVWFRDLLHKSIGWGVMAIVLTAGWFAAGDGEVLSLDTSDLSLRDKTIGYLLISWAIWLAWIICTARLWTRCPRHATIPSRGTLYAVLLACSVAKLALDAFAVKD